MNLSLAAALLAFDRLTGEDAIAAASAALDQGLYSRSLAMAFYEPSGSSAAVFFFRKALAELGVPIPARDKASLTVAREHARRIVSGAVSPYEGARQIWCDLANESGADSSLRVFVGLASEWEDDQRHRAEYEAQIMIEVERLLKSEAEGG